MDPLLDRFHRLLRSMFQTSGGDWDFNLHGSHDPGAEADRDYEDAWEELESFLGKGSNGSTGREREYQSPSFHRPPEELRKDYLILEVPFGAQFDDVKKAHRILMKKYHPDRHAVDPASMKSATEKTQAINLAFGRLKAWELARKGTL
jgi:DnaJ-class molecular chaperone